MMTDLFRFGRQVSITTVPRDILLYTFQIPEMDGFFLRKLVFKQRQWVGDELSVHNLNYKHY